MKNKEIIDWFTHLQTDIIYNLEKLDGKKQFEKTEWKRDGGGGGKTRIIRDGNVIEKGGVNFSEVYGKTPKNIKIALGLKNNDFYATGISIVLHPKNPNVPIIHMNTRYFEIKGETWWFGGGIDLTPHYIDTKEAVFFHNQMKNTCDKFDSSFYKIHKQWADDYYFITHRGETRGIGGTFFDKLNDKTTPHAKTKLFEYVKAVGSSFSDIYTKIATKKKDVFYTEEQKKWQNLRRGRYVEFNLVYDKGTKFGLNTNGRTESILMSLPKNASWEYNFEPKKNSKEEFTQKHLIKGIDWINVKNYL